MNNAVRALTTAAVQRFQRNERATIRWICKVKISNDYSLLNKLCLKNLDITLRTNRLRWFGHVCRCEGWIEKCTQHEVAGKRNVAVLEKLGNSALTTI